LDIEENAISTSSAPTYNFSGDENQQTNALEDLVGTNFTGEE
jgi:hypothetical protein